MPYSDLDDKAFWKLCRADPEFRVDEIYAPKFTIAAGERIVTAGSCFAQNIARYLKASSLDFWDVEPAPRGMNPSVAPRFGYGLFSARYGNVYTAAQFRQLVEAAGAARSKPVVIWERGGRYFDAFRPGVEPEGLATKEEVIAHRHAHLARVARMLLGMDVLIFTLGLTEAWRGRETGQVFPSAPGVIAGQFDGATTEFVNFSFTEVHRDLVATLSALREAVPHLKVLLTVSPVPLTATASGQHVLAATIHSKAVLRSVAGEIAHTDPLTDYFPSYEIITGAPFVQQSYAANLRSVSRIGIERVMRVFFGAQGLPVPMPDEGRPGATAKGGDSEADICEEAMLEAFAPQ